jgi:hypothetical protein
MKFIENAYAHKTGYKHNHGGGNGNVPEIDGNSITVLLVILGSCYLLFKYARKK